MQLQLELGPDIIRSYKRLGYRAWYALAEFLDNSTQSFFDNRDALDTASGGRAVCEIDVTYDRKAGVLRIHDTAMGMSLSQVKHALCFGKPPAKTTGRSEFGLGLKTASCWFGDEWKVTTKKLGESKEIEITVDVERIAAGDLTLAPVFRDKPVDLHYTTVEIAKMHRPLHHATIRRIQTYLRSMYRVDIREGSLLIRFEGGEPLQWDEQFEFIKDAEGTPYKRSFDTEIEGKRIWGWIGVLLGGARTKAGFAQIRRGRVIQGQPDAWRPEGIFGVDRNDLLNQRLTGEINLDPFGISHTKDAILWQGEEEEKLEAYLQQEFGNYIAEARQTYKSKGIGGPAPADVQVAVDELKQQLESPEFVDAIQLTDVPSEEVIKASVKHVVDAVSPSEPDLRVTIGTTPCRVYLSHDLSPGDPYFASDTAGDIIVSINCNHTHWSRITGGPDAILRYLLECVYDAIAEWKCAKKGGPISHDTIKWLKDGLLRLEVGVGPQNE